VANHAGERTDTSPHDASRRRLETHSKMLVTGDNLGLSSLTSVMAVDISQRLAIGRCSSVVEQAFRSLS
jgi:hypothetical protein